MNKHRKGKFFVKMMAIGVIAIAVCIFVVMSLWNWLMPVIFGLTTVSFWQAGGLLLLSKIFFGFGGGGFKGRNRHKKRHFRHKMKEKWMNMSDEERSVFKMEMKEKWGRHKPWNVWEEDNKQEE